MKGTRKSREIELQMLFVECFTRGLK